MGWWMTAAAAAQIGSGFSANRTAKKIGRDNANLIRMETDEQLRRMDRVYRFELGEAEATYATRGLLLDGTPSKILNEMTAEYYRQRKWTQQVGEQRATVARKGASGFGTGQIIEGIGLFGSAITAPNPRAQPKTQT